MPREILIELAIVVGTALTSSLLTAGLAYWIYLKKIRPRLEREIERKLGQMEEELGHLIRSRVRQGVLDAVAALPSASVLRETQKTVARTAADLVEGGLAALWGEKPKKGSD